MAIFFIIKNVKKQGLDVLNYFIFSYLCRNINLSLENIIF